MTSRPSDPQAGRVQHADFRPAMTSETGEMMQGSMLDLFQTTPAVLLYEAGYRIDPEEFGIQRRDPYTLAAAADILVQEDAALLRGELAYLERRLVKFKPKRPDIDRENIIEGIAHILRGHSGYRWYTGTRFSNPDEQEARAFTLETLATDQEIDFLLSTNAPWDLAYFARRFGMTVKGMKERMKLKGQPNLLELRPREKSGLATVGICEDCGRTRFLVPHHTTYARLGWEWSGDGLMLCDDCHSARHQ